MVVHKKGRDVASVLCSITKPLAWLQSTRCCCFYILALRTLKFQFYKKCFSSNCSILEVQRTWEMSWESQKHRSITKSCTAHFSHFTVSVDIINWNCWQLFIVLVCYIQQFSPKWSCALKSRFQCFNGAQWDVTDCWSALITINNGLEWMSDYATNANTFLKSLEWQSYDVWWIDTVSFQ